MIGKNIPVVKDHPFVTTEGIKAQEEKQEEIKVKAKANKTYRGSRANGDFWRRKKQKQINRLPPNRKKEIDTLGFRQKQSCPKGMPPFTTE